MQSTHVFPENMGPRMSWKRESIAVSELTPCCSDPPQPTIWLCLTTDDTWIWPLARFMIERHVPAVTQDMAGWELEGRHCKYTTPSAKHSGLWSHSFPRLFNREGVGNRTTNQNIVAMVVFTAETLVQIKPIKASLSHGRKWRNNSCGSASEGGRKHTGRNGSKW